MAVLDEIRPRPDTIDATISPEASLLEAARLMSQLNVAALSVCDGDSVVGVVTDRDITLRATARGRPPRSMAVAEVMSWYDMDARVRSSAIRGSGNESTPVDGR